MASGESIPVYIGTYTGGESPSKGIYRSTLDLDTGRLSDPILAAETESPSFLEIHPNGKFLYAVGKTGGAGGVSAFEIDADTGKLEILNQQPSGGNGPCHVCIDHAGKNVLVANYSSGSASVIPIQADGSLGKPTGFSQHEGSSANAERQEGPHAHSVTVSPDDRFAFVADLGIDKIMIYRLDAEKGTIVANDPPFAEVEPGAGPRHFAFHPTGKFAYGINELDGSIASFSYDSETGALTKIQKITTLPAGFQGSNTCAEVRVHPTGKFVYGSNRGHDSIAVYRADPDTGVLAFVEHETGDIKTPRNFNIDPTGKFCLVGNQDSDCVVVFRINQEGGTLEPTGHKISVGKPVCIRFLQGALSTDIPTEHSALHPVVEVEEEVYQYEPAQNGAGPMWCQGSTCLVRIGDAVFASGIETLKDFRPLNNCRWMLFQRETDGWKQVQFDPTGRTREPCPLACFPDGRLFLSANPTVTTDPEAYGGPARPEVLEFAATDCRGPFETILPVWDGTPEFTEHSYRSFAADGPGRELILFQNIGYTHAEWAFRDSSGEWVGNGKLNWPWGAEYDEPQPIRVCYPNVALKGHAVHFCGVSDIVEPYTKWREFKHELTGQKWDYDFRRLFYARSPDISTGQFEDWIEIAGRDKTCGWISPGDLWVAPDGAAHIVWTERALDERLREKFFPNEMQSHSLNYAVVQEGRVVTRQTLMLAEEGKSNQIPGSPRFQVTPENRLFVFYYVSGSDADEKPVSENRMMEIGPDVTPGAPVVVPLEYPLTSYFTATVRGGSPPSKDLDLLGMRAGAGGIYYARVRLCE
jgi:6-phosphogluconolactonase